ncbi:hypothetical protein G9409_11070 [Chlorobium sp. BLA1]|uniref:hypothetical protein n=1 Tax=Candidatus Chlorobium masyuteum TaxID=2716876 RepID=UPI001423B79B|nr:hypothetical protein [Candidatus Chlorobium masyuteum]NHQ61111.1 hypothetical protein [Candidatus Chlorobium masyuteum]
MNYENRITVFIDILGFKEIIRKTCDNNGNDLSEKVDLLNESLLMIRDYLDIDKPDEHFSKSKKITQFSDSIVISFEETETSEIYYTLSDILGLLVNLTRRGIICRGGIAYGKLIHTDKILFGPAMVTAYETESKAALYPRVILDISIIELAAKHHAKHHTPKDELNAIKDIVSVDGDGMLYVDYITKAESELDDPELDFPEYINKLKEIIETGLKEAKAPDIKIKYSWMKTKFNDYISELKKDNYTEIKTK